MKIAILGAGKVGTTIALMLKKSKFCSNLLLADIEPRQELKSLEAIDFVKLDITDRSSLKKIIADRDAVALQRQPPALQARAGTRRHKYYRQQLCQHV